MKARFAIAALACALALPASAGWFDVSNYEGKVSGKTVYLSIQILDGAHPEGPKDSRLVIGSFYDTVERRPKAFHGKRMADGRLQLCETQHVGDFIIPQRDSWLRMKEKPCLIALAPQGDALKGRWGKAGEAAALTLVGTMNNVAQDRVTGKMDIPLWVDDDKYMYVGTWGLNKGRLMLRTLSAIGIASGKRERTATLACMEGGKLCPGLLYTEVYLAGRTELTPGEVTVGYSDGEQAEHDTVVLHPVR